MQMINCEKDWNVIHAEGCHFEQLQWCYCLVHIQVAAQHNWLFSEHQSLQGNNRSLIRRMSFAFHKVKQ